MIRRALLVSLLAVLGAAGCTSSDGASDPPADASPVATDQPPFGLDDAPLPGSQADIDALLAAMPTEVGGLTGAVQGNEIGYGHGGMGEVSGSMETFLRVMTVGGEEYGAGAPFIEAIVQNGGIEIEGQELDPDAPVVYVAGTTPTGGVTYASVMWADPGSRYVLLIQGTSPEQRAALIEAYRAAAATALA